MKSKIKCSLCHGTELMREGQGGFFCAACGHEVVSLDYLKRPDSKDTFEQAMTQLVPPREA